MRVFNFQGFILGSDQIVSAPHLEKWLIDRRLFEAQREGHVSQKMASAEDDLVIGIRAEHNL